jgi:hypothetical protein
MLLVPHLTGVTTSFSIHSQRGRDDNDRTEIWVPLFPAHRLGSAAPPGLAGIIAPSEYDALINWNKGTKVGPAKKDTMSGCFICRLQVIHGPKGVVPNAQREEKRTCRRSWNPWSL